LLRVMLCVSLRRRAWHSPNGNSRPQVATLVAIVCTSFQIFIVWCFVCHCGEQRGTAQTVTRDHKWQPLLLLCVHPSRENWQFQRWKFSFQFVITFAEKIGCTTPTSRCGYFFSCESLSGH
jgi:hypothetical protein